MKRCMLFGALLITFSLSAQYNADYRFPGHIRSNSYLLKSGNNIVLIHQTDPHNETHIWTTFNSSLLVTDKKKLTTPNASEIINQVYLEGHNTIIRIDQWVAEDRLHVSAYTFDKYGNILYKKELTDFTVGVMTDKKLSQTPFLISQSSDKKIIALVQPQSTMENSLDISTIVFDNKLDVLNTFGRSIVFNYDLFDFYIPLVDNSGTVFLITADKFNSYKINSILTSYQFPLKTDMVKKEFNFFRKKIKELNFTLSDTDNKLLFSALFSQKENKTNVTGILYSGYDYAKQEYLNTREYNYSSTIKKELKNIYGSAGHKGNILNHLKILPDNLSTNTNYNYAFLLPPVTRQEAAKSETTNSLPTLKTGIYETQAGIYTSSREVDMIHSVIGNDFKKPKNPTASIRTNQSNNLLFFSLKDSVQTNTHQFIKIKPVTDNNYNFTTFFSDENGYSCLYYSFKKFGKPYLKKTTIDHSGNVLEKTIFEDKNKIIIPGYPFIFDQGNLITFYEDKITAELGLISIKL